MTRSSKTISDSGIKAKDGRVVSNGTTEGLDLKGAHQQLQVQASSLVKVPGMSSVDKEEVSMKLESDPILPWPVFTPCPAVPVSHSRSALLPASHSAVSFAAPPQPKRRDEGWI